MFFVGHAFGEQIVYVPLRIPLVVILDQTTRFGIYFKPDACLEEIGQVCFAGYMGEQMANIAEPRLLGADVAF